MDGASRAPRREKSRHLLDHRFELELPLIDKAALDGLPLKEYTHLLMVDGQYDDISADALARVKSWVADGGTVVASKGAAQWADGLLKIDIQDDNSEDADGESDSHSDTDSEMPRKEDRRAYGDYDDERAAQRIAGAIFQVGLDLTHPLGYGYRAETLSVFRNGTLVLPLSENPYDVAVYSESPLLSGYTSAENLSRVSGSAALTATRLGDGAVIRFADNPNFRAFWYGTEKLLSQCSVLLPAHQGDQRAKHLGGKGRVGGFRN